jgi:serine/threonine protein kinase
MPDPSLRPGALIAGRYRLERLLGEGGMAIVWEATHTVTQRGVAMKFLRESLRDKEELRVRFHREASAASALHHPNVVEIVDVFDYEEGAPVMVMELFHGETLGDKLERDERLSLEETAALIVPVISAVGAAHALGIVHRDLKPDNVFLSQGPAGQVVKVLDFGIAKLTNGAGARQLRTEAGSMLGTPCYMAPEQAQGNEVVDHRADIWSLGVMLYECLSGTRPIEGDDLVQVVTRLVSAAIMPLERLAPHLPHDVAATVMQMLARDPARRPADLSEVSRLFSTYTRTVAPPFGPASTGKAWAPTSEEVARARIVHSKADPRGPTLLSAAPLPSSVTVASDHAKQREWRPNKVVMGLLGGALGLTAVVIVLLRSFGSSHDPSPNGGQALEAKTNGGAPMATPPATTASAGPIPAASGSAPAAAAPKASKVAQHHAKPVPRTAPPAERTPDAPASKPNKDENTLFSGRK